MTSSRVEQLAEGKVSLLCGDCLALLSTLEANSIDSCVTDPPYHLTTHKMTTPQSIQADYNNGKGNPFCRPQARAGFMGKKWDGGDIAFRPELWREVFRVLKPGAFLLSFGGTRTYHRMACAIEDAGFEIRDSIQWLYGSGLPKSLDVSKAIDKAAGAEREVVGVNQSAVRSKSRDTTWTGDVWGDNGATITAPATDAARQWSGFGTALKPACEPIVLARKPLSESTVAANVLRWGTGALNIDGCRVAGEFKSGWSESGSRASENVAMSGGNYARDPKPDNASGRWPANVVHDGSDEVVGAFPETDSRPGLTKPNGRRVNCYGEYGRMADGAKHDDFGSAARFFYTSKADADDRLGSKHPTVKPLDLVQYLVRLVTPPRGLVLDCFAGTGTLGEACLREGFRAILIEREEEYQEDIRRRMRLALTAGPQERARESFKAKTKGKPVDAGPLFGGTTEAIGGGGA